MPIGPHARGRRRRRHEQRDGVRAGPVDQRRAAEPRRRCSDIPATPRTVRVDLVRGLELVRRRPAGEAAEQAASSRRRSASRCACSGCAGTSTAGTSYGPAHMYDVKMGVDANGKIVALDWTSLRPGQHATSTPTKELLGHGHVAGGPGQRRPDPVRLGGLQRSTTPARGCSRRRSRCTAARSRCSALRAPNAPQSYFASEQIVDELAYAAKMDPVAFRRQNIDGTTIARRPLAVGARRVRRSRPAGSRRSPPRTCRAATS